MPSVTRSQTGRTPKKPEFPGFVETPPVRRSRHSTPAPSVPSVVIEQPKQEVASTRKKPANPDHRIDDSGEYEFCGPIGTGLVMVGFPIMMYYFWVGQVYYDSQFPWPAKGESVVEFLQSFVDRSIECATPTLRSFAVYWGFLMFQCILYVTLPGVWTKGHQIPHRGNIRLDYFCNAMWSFYVTIFTFTILHLTGVFPITELVDDFGAYMSTGVISGIVVSFVAYFSAIARGAQHRMTGNFIYDFFMGAELNPRIGIIDLKMMYEVRLPWFLLTMISASAAVKQYELYGYVSPQVAFFVFAHWLYTNACGKGEELIPTTYDMAVEKWGYMLIFWNMAGVPLTYCHGVLYLVRHHPSTYQWSTTTNVAIYTLICCAYFIFDTANSQKNRFRQQERGTLIVRNTFPQLPYQTLQNPTFIRTANGGTLLTSGWYGVVRKAHYTADFFQLGSWGLICGFNSPLPWFLPVFFTTMIFHRTYRDHHRCAKKYGKDWEEYCRQVPYLYIPYVF